MREKNPGLYDGYESYEETTGVIREVTVREEIYSGVLSLLENLETLLEEDS